MRNITVFLLGIIIGFGIVFEIQYRNRLADRIQVLETNQQFHTETITSIRVILTSLFKQIQSTYEHKTQLECTSKNLYFEAAGEPIQGKMAIAQVVNNRLNKRNKYDNVCDVVYEPKQFSWVDDHLPNTPNIKNKIDKRAWNESVSVADMYLNDNYNQDPELMNATMYHAVWAQPNWDYDKLRRIKAVGNHVFYEEL